MEGARARATTGNILRQRNPTKKKEKRQSRNARFLGELWRRKQHAGASKKIPTRDGIGLWQKMMVHPPAPVIAGDKQEGKFFMKSRTTGGTLTKKDKEHSMLCFFYQH